MESYYSYDQTKNNSLAKVFGYMFLGLLVTALSAYGLFYLFEKISCNCQKGML